MRPISQLAYDYLNRRPVLDENQFIFRDSIYHANPTQLIGYKVNQAAYPDTDRKHVDVYIYVPQFLNDPQFGNFDGDVRTNYGKSPSDLLDADEDVSTGHPSDVNAVLHANSLMFPGPQPSRVGDANDNTTWTRPNAIHNAGFLHEFQHAMNGNDPWSGLNELFSTAAEALGGVEAEAPVFDASYVHSLLRWNPDSSYYNYANWRSFLSYVAFNFRGVNVYESGRSDDLLWRWAMGPTRKLSDLIQRLSPGECAECATKPYFNGLSPTNRFHLLLHNWRVASFLNRVAFADGQYGFAQPSALERPDLGFDPMRDIGAWQNVDGLAWDDSVVAAHEVAISTAQTVRDLSLAGPVGGGKVHALSLERYGSEYWVIRSDPSLHTADRTLVVRVAPLAPCGGLRVMGSAIAYTQQPVPEDSLWKHPQWASLSVTPQWTEADPGQGAEIELLIPSFGLTHKAVLVVVTTSQVDDNFDSQRVMPYQLNLALRAPIGSYPPHVTTVQNETTFDDFPTWSPAGDEIAYMRGGVVPAQIYRRKLDGTPATALVPQNAGQFRPDWSPRGDWIAFDQETPSNSDIFAFNPSTQELRQLSFDSHHDFGPVFCPNGQRLVYLRFTNPGGNWTYQLRRVDLAGNPAADSLLVSRTQVFTPRWSPDGRWICFNVNDSLYAVGAEGANFGVVLARFTLPLNTTEIDLPLGNQRLAYATQWAPSGCGGGQAQRLAILDTLSGEGEATFYRTATAQCSPRWSFDGTRLAFSADQGVPGSQRDILFGQVGYNQPPYIGNLGELADRTVEHNQSLSFTLIAGDPEGEALTYRAAYLPPGATFSSSGTFNWPAPHSDGEYYVVFRVLDASGGVSNNVVLYTVDTPSGGCPFADTRTASGWQVENSLLSRSLTGSLSLDTYRLKAAPAVFNGRYHIRLRENEQETTTLDQVRLVAVDHAPSLRAFSVGDRVMLGTRVPAARITTAAGQDITTLVSGGTGFTGQAGDTLLVEMSLASPGTFGAQATQDHSPPGVLESGKKKQLAIYERPQEFSATPTTVAVDQAILSGTGILVQSPDGQGGWRTFEHHYPREFGDEAPIDSVGGGPLRLVFVGQHELTFVGHIEPAAATPTPQTLALRAARHSRLGNALAAVSAAGGTTTSLVPGDTLDLEFAATDVPLGQVREWFLLSRGVYTAAVSPARQETPGVQVPTRFALEQNQPNPFARTTTIDFALPIATVARLEIFDLAGRRVAVLADNQRPAGYHSVTWDRKGPNGALLRPGVYVYRLNAGAFRERKKMVLLP